MMNQDEDNDDVQKIRSRHTPSSYADTTEETESSEDEERSDEDHCHESVPEIKRDISPRVDLMNAISYGHTVQCTLTDVEADTVLATADIAREDVIEIEYMHDSISYTFGVVFTDVRLPNGMTELEIGWVDFDVPVEWDQLEVMSSSQSDCSKLIGEIIVKVLGR